MTDTRRMHRPSVRIPLPTTVSASVCLVSTSPPPHRVPPSPRRSGSVRPRRGAGRWPRRTRRRCRHRTALRQPSTAPPVDRGIGRPAVRSVRGGRGGIAHRDVLDPPPFFRSPCRSDPGEQFEEDVCRYPTRDGRLPEFQSLLERRGVLPLEVEEVRRIQDGSSAPNVSGTVRNRSDSRSFGSSIADSIRSTSSGANGPANSCGSGIRESRRSVSSTVSPSRLCAFT